MINTYYKGAAVSDKNGRVMVDCKDGERFPLEERVLDPDLPRGVTSWVILDCGQIGMSHHDLSIPVAITYASTDIDVNLPIYLANQLLYHKNGCFDLFYSIKTMPEEIGISKIHQP